MKRLDAKSLPRFLETASVAVILIGSDDGSTTLDQAEEFALLWADTIASNIVGVRFGYIDGVQNPEACGFLGVDELPTILIVRSGDVTHHFKGRGNRHSIMAGLQWRPLHNGPSLGASRPHGEAAPGLRANDFGPLLSPMSA